MSDGLPTNDIWGLLEDKTGKIWLSSISNEIGYMENDKYHYARLPKLQNTLYPQQINHWNDGLIFISPDSNLYALWLNEGNEIKKYALPPNFLIKEKKIYISTPVHYMYVFISDDKRIFLLNKMQLFAIKIKYSKLHFEFITTIKANKDSCKLLEGDIIAKNLLVHNELIPSTKIETVNLSDGRCIYYDLRSWGINEPINRMVKERNGNDQFILAYTNNYLVKLLVDTAITLTKVEKIQNLTGFSFNKNITINTIIQDSLWKNCVGTTTNGIYFNYKTKNIFNKNLKLDLHNYKFVGGKTDYLNFWWNKSTSTLLKIDRNLKITRLKCNDVNDINNIILFKTDTFLIMGKDLNDGILWFKNSNNHFFKNYRKHTKNNVYAVVKNNENDFYFVSQTGFFYSELQNDSFADKIINTDRYKGLQYDPITKNYWAYNDDKILIHNTLTDKKISNNDLQNFGIKKIDQILIDSIYGNIFIKGNDKINLYNRATSTVTTLFPNINAKKAQMVLYRGVLIVAGRFGVIFCKINASDNFSSPLLYPNIKDINYKYVYDIQASTNKLLINTDKGAYSVEIPTATEIMEDKNDYATKYKFMVDYRDSSININNTDSIIFEQKNLSIIFDIINPTGNGHPKYLYRLDVNDTIWHELNSNELTLPQSLTPGKYYKIKLKAYDEVWISDELNLTVYIKPYWWQLVYQSKLFWGGILILFLGLIAFTIYLTKMMVNRNNAKKNLRQSLELKSVYSQINPHFIFNTLGTLMYFIRKKETDEAYSHVSKFSKLLRAYIKSARNKYITIENEIENLNNYIQLQQSRFEDRFEYSIVVDNEINTDIVKIPSLLLQPIVENAIDHGLFHRETTGFLKIEFKKIPLTNEIECIIDDNGIGRKKSKIISANSIVKSESYGEQLITDLVTIFNKYEKINISIRYIDKVEPETGTTVIINIKYPKDAK